MLAVNGTSDHKAGESPDRQRAKRKKRRPPKSADFEGTVKIFDAAQTANFIVTLFRR